jgi:hypothetical protein
LTSPKHGWGENPRHWAKINLFEIAKAVGLEDWYRFDYVVYSEVAHGGRFGLADMLSSFPAAAVDQANKAFSVLLSHAADALGRPIDEVILQLRQEAAETPATAVDVGNASY